MLIFSNNYIFVAALSGSRSEELATIDKIMEQDPDSISYKERILVYINRLMQKLGFWGIFLFASVSVFVLNMY